MRKSTLVLLIFAIVLIITGIVLCSVGNTKAAIDGSQIFKQVKDSNGNLIETIDLSEETLNKINIKVSEANVNVYGNSSKSYVEIINFNAIQYSAYTNNRALTIENDLISAAINRVSGGDIGYNGLRDYFRITKSNNQKAINIYLNSEDDIKIFDISLGIGNVSIDSISTISDYNIKLNQGNVLFKNTSEISKITSSIGKGNLELTGVLINQSDIKLSSGDLTVSSPAEVSYRYDLTVEMGEITVGEEKFKGSHKTEIEDPSGFILANVEVGNIKIKIGE